MITLNTQYTHYKNKQTYITKDYCKIQENDTWIDAIIYLPKDENKLFVRSSKEFKEKFIKLIQKN